MPATASARGWIAALYFFLVFLAALLFGITSYPTLEGWGVWHAFNVNGFAFFVETLPTQAERPLHMLSTLFAWLTPGGYGVGCMLVGASYAVARGVLILGLARQLKLQDEPTLFLLLLGLLQPLWPGALFERYHSAQLAFLFFLSGWWLLLAGERSYPCVSRCLTSVVWLAGLACYPGMFVVVGLSPLAFLLLNDRHRAVRILVAGLPALFLFLVWFKLASTLFPGSYLNQLSTNDRPLLVLHDLRRGLWSHSPVPVRLVLLGVCLLGFLQFPRNDRRKNLSWAFLTFGLTPLTALVFAKNRSLLMDPERVCFPVLGWICVCFLAAGHPSASVQGTLWPSRVLSRLGTVVILLCSAWMPFQTLGIVHLQKQVLEALRNSSIPWEQSPRVLVQDPSNQLGRLYTFQPPHLQLAWSALRREGTPSLASTHDDDQHPPVDYRVVLRARGGWWGYFSTWEVVETESFLPPTVLTDRRPAAPAPVRTIPD